MEIMKSLTRQGHTITCTIHQPSSEIFHLFDNLILLSNGELEYFGSVSGAKSHFAKKGYSVPAEVNPADFYSECFL
jgi:ABC-type multidrug transport system ATPase subunit